MTGNPPAFVSLETASAENWRTIMAEEEAMAYGRRAANLLLMLLREQQADPSFGMPVNTYRHSLQTATRVLDAGESDEMIVCSLFHDVAEKMAALSHGAAIAEILGPFVSERVEWMLRHHPHFQLYHFVERPGNDCQAREAYRGSPHFEFTAHFCRTYDQNSFDPRFVEQPLERFEPIVTAYFDRFNSLKSLRHPAPRR
jgi:predicted HD phosphohydrolase